MKDYKEKYEQVIKSLRSLIKNDPDHIFYEEDIIERIPELKESEDEKIRKTLIDFHKSTIDIKGIKGEKIVAWLEKQGEQKHVDNIQINPSEYINDMGGNGCYLKNTAQTSAWSEEDENRLNSCISILNTSDGFETLNSKWLKSLKDRYTWKPSKEQIQALAKNIEYVNVDNTKPILKGLLEQLEKLKG